MPFLLAGGMPSFRNSAGSGHPIQNDFQLAEDFLVISPLPSWPVKWQVLKLTIQSIKQQRNDKPAAPPGMHYTWQTPQLGS